MVTRSALVNYDRVPGTRGFQGSLNYAPDGRERPLELRAPKSSRFLSEECRSLVLFWKARAAANSVPESWT